MRPLLFAFIIVFLLSSGARSALAVEGTFSDLDVSAGTALTAGVKLKNKGDFQGAGKYFDAAIRAQPELWIAYYERALVFWAQKNWPAALQDLNSTIRLQPAFFEASYMRARLNLKTGNYATALKDFDLLAKLTVKVQQPGQLGIILNERAWLRATCVEASFRNGQLAVADARRACELDHWRTSAYIDTLAAACAEAGDFDSAVRYEEQAMDVSRSETNESARQQAKSAADKTVTVEMVKAAKQSLESKSRRLESYRQHHPYRQRPG